MMIIMSKLPACLLSVWIKTNMSREKLTSSMLGNELMGHVNTGLSSCVGYGAGVEHVKAGQRNAGQHMLSLAQPTQEAS